MSVVLGRHHAEPRPTRLVLAPVDEELVEDRLQQVHRHDHVRVERFFVPPDVLDEEGADPPQRPVAPDDRRPAPVRVGGRGEDRLLQEILPVAREFPLEDDLRRHRLRDAPVSGEHHVVSLGERVGGPEGEAGHRKALERLHQGEPRLLIVGDDVGRDGDIRIVDDPHRLGLGDEIADGEDEPGVVDRDSVSRPLGPENGGGHRILGDVRPERHHRAQHPVKVERHLFRGGGAGAIGFQLHRAILCRAGGRL